MGWNSWDCYGTTVTEDEVLANAEFMAEHLLPHGWDTVVVDIAWSDPTARAHGYNEGAPLVVDDHGRPQPAPNRFPSTADGAGFGPLAERVHGLGLRFGVHVMRGIPRVATEQDLPILGTDATARDVADPGNRCEWNPDNIRPYTCGPTLIPAGPADQRSRCRSGGPLYAESGRIRALLAVCSMMCAVHPVIRAATKIGVKVAVSKPIRWYAGPEG
jgi:hypothetical protein